MTLKELTDKLSAVGFRPNIKRKANEYYYGIIELIQLDKKYPHIDSAKLHYTEKYQNGVLHYNVTQCVACVTKNGAIITGSSINNFIKHINEYNK